MKRCVHHWHIDSNNIGQCQKCKEQKDFGKLLRRALKLKKNTPMTSLK